MQYFEQIRKTGFIRRAGEIARATSCGPIAAKQAVIDELHAEALAEDAYRTELKIELRKFAIGAAPYPYVRINDGEPESRIVDIDLAHAEALRINVAKRAARRLNAELKANASKLSVVLSAPSACLHAGCHPGRCAYGRPVS